MHNKRENQEIIFTMLISQQRIRVELACVVLKQHTERKELVFPMYVHLHVKPQHTVITTCAVHVFFNNSYSPQSAHFHANKKNALKSI